MDRLRTIAGDGEVFVSDLSGNATVMVQVPARDRPAAERLERELRLRAHEALRAEGVYALRRPRAEGGLRQTPSCSIV